MQSHTRKCVGRCCEFVYKIVDQLRKVSALCLADHQIEQEDLESFGEPSETNFRMVVFTVHGE